MVGIEIFTLLRAGFKKTDKSKSQNKCSLHGTTFEGLRAPKKSSSIRKISGYRPRSHQKSLEKWSMLENDKTGTEEENFSLHRIHDGQKVWDDPGNPGWGQHLFRSVYRGPPVYCITWRITGIEASFFRWENFHLWFCLQQREWSGCNVWNYVSEYRRVSTTKHLASIMMLGVVSLNGEKMLLIWFERSYRLMYVIYKEFLETKVLKWVQKITKKPDYVFNRTECRDTRQGLCRTGWTGLAQSLHCGTFCESIGTKYRVQEHHPLVSANYCSIIILCLE